MIYFYIHQVSVFIIDSEDMHREQDGNFKRKYYLIVCVCFLPRTYPLISQILYMFLQCHPELYNLISSHQFMKHTPVICFPFFEINTRFSNIW